MKTPFASCDAELQKKEAEERILVLIREAYEQGAMDAREHPKIPIAFLAATYVRAFLNGVHKK